MSLGRIHRTNPQARHVVKEPSLTPIEIASGTIVGEASSLVRTPEAASGVTPRAASEDWVRRALTKTPCIVAFSGGRDSSAALATAVHVARREGLPLPIPATLRFKGIREADESSWQRSVVEHLVLDDWEVLDVPEDELDLLGPVATALLRKHGLLCPPNAYFLYPLMELARGGSFVTGWDGDGLLNTWRWQKLAGVLRRSQAPRLSDLARFAYVASPRVLRRLVERKRPGVDFSWLRPHAAATVRERIVVEDADQPGRWGAWIDWYRKRRHLALIRDSSLVLTQETEVTAVPFFESPTFITSLAMERSIAGPGDRTEIMSWLFGDLLPAAILQRSDKALLMRPQWGRPSKDFTSRWDGEGVDPSIVDVEDLKRLWHSGIPVGITALLLQDAFLRSTD